MIERIKVQMHLVVEIDPAAWAENMSAKDPSYLDIRNDVRDYVMEALPNLGLLEDASAEAMLKPCSRVRKNP